MITSKSQILYALSLQPCQNYRMFHFNFNWQHSAFLTIGYSFGEGGGIPKTSCSVLKNMLFLGVFILGKQNRPGMFDPVSCFFNPKILTQATHEIFIKPCCCRIFLTCLKEVMLIQVLFPRKICSSDNISKSFFQGRNDSTTITEVLLQFAVHTKESIIKQMILEYNKN